MALVRSLAPRISCASILASTSEVQDMLKHFCSAGVDGNIRRASFGSKRTEKPFSKISHPSPSP